MENIFLKILNVSIISGFMITVVLFFRLLFSRGASHIRCILWGIVMLRLLIPFYMVVPDNIIFENFPVFKFRSYIEKFYSYHPLDMNLETGEKTEDGIMINNTDVALEDNIVPKTGFNAMAGFNRETGFNTVVGFNREIGFDAAVGFDREIGFNVTAGLSDASEVNSVSTFKNENTKGDSLEKGGNIISGKTDIKIQKYIKILARIWILVMMCMAAYMIVGVLRLRNRVRMAIPETKMYHNRKVKIYRDSNILSPFLFGIVKPLIYVPYNIADESLPYVIAHEQSHIKRRDYLFKPLFFTALSIHWFNPMVWIAYAMFCKDTELACDERVLRDNKELDKISYSEILLSHTAHKNLMGILTESFGENGVKKRVRNILNYKKPKSIVKVLGGMVCLLLSIFFVMNSTKPTNANNDIFEEKTAENESIPVSATEDRYGKNPLPMEKLLELTESGQIQRMIEENDIGALADFINRTENQMTSWCETVYNGMTYRICADYESTEDGEVISYIGVWNLTWDDWYKIYNRKTDEYASVNLREFLNRSYDVEDYFEFTVPKEFERSEFDGVLSYNQRGWIFEQSESQIPHGAGAAASRYCMGGIGFIEKDSLIFKDGELTEVEWRDNHMGGSRAETIEGLKYGAVMKEYVFDVFSMPELEEYLSEHPEADEAEIGTTRFWYIFMYDEDKDAGYMAFLNEEYFSKEDTIEFAKSIICSRLMS